MIKELIFLVKYIKINVGKVYNDISRIFFYT